MHGKVKVYKLSQNELERIRTGWKCDLSNRPKRIGVVDWKWRAGKQRVQNSKPLMGITAPSVIRFGVSLKNGETR
jgi:hypothetical protein